MKLSLRKQLIPAWRSPGLASSALIFYTPTGSEKYVRGRQEEEEEYRSLIRSRMKRTHFDGQTKITAPKKTDCACGLGNEQVQCRHSCTW